MLYQNILLPVFVLVALTFAVVFWTGRKLSLSGGPDGAEDSFNYHLHTLFYVLGAKDIRIWVEKTKWLVENRGMVLALTHPDYLRDARHFAMYEEYLDYLSTIPRAWHCLPREMAARYMSIGKLPTAPSDSLVPQ